MSGEENVDNIPIAIAKYLALPDVEYFNIYDKFAYLIKSADGDNYYLQNYLIEEGFITEKLGEEVYKIINDEIGYEDIFTLYEHWLDR